MNDEKTTTTQPFVWNENMSNVQKIQSTNTKPINFARTLYRWKSCYHCGRYICGKAPDFTQQQTIFKHWKQ